MLSDVFHVRRVIFETLHAKILIANNMSIDKDITSIFVCSESHVFYGNMQTDFPNLYNQSH